MDSYLLQDWITIGGQSGDAGDTITQGESSWLDLEDYDDVVFYTDVRQLTAIPKITFQTSPVPEDSAFQAILPTITLALNTTPRVDRALASLASVPLARYLRWKLSATGTVFMATFRVSVAVNGPGA